jgi:hypothetical protein
LEVLLACMTKTGRIVTSTSRKQRPSDDDNLFGALGLDVAAITLALGLLVRGFIASLDGIHHIVVFAAPRRRVLPGPGSGCLAKPLSHVIVRNHQDTKDQRRQTQPTGP